jgi:GT2 family glycosyltransferase
MTPRPPAAAGELRLGIVVVSFESPEVTRRCLESLAADPSAVGRRTVVVDNSRRREAAVSLDLLPAGTLLVPCPDNPGFGAGANRGVERLRREVDLSAYVVLNHDVEVFPGFLDAAAAALAVAGTGAAAGPIHLDRPAGPLWYAGGDFRPLTGTVRQSRAAADAARPREVGFLPGTALAVAAAAWEEVGGFDPRIFLYHEDLDLCLRLRRAGWRLRFSPGMEAVHHMGTSTGSRSYSAFYLEHMTRTRFAPYRSRPYRLYLALLHTPYVALRALRILAREGGAGGPKVRALARGHRGALAGLLRR